MEKTDVFLNIKETASLLKVHVSHVNKLVAEGKIPSYKMGKRRLFKRDDIINWMERFRVAPEEEKKVKKKTKIGKR